MSRAKKTCPCCRRRNVGPIKTWSRITQYADKAQNEMRSCIHCIREDDLHYAELWVGYYTDQGYGARISDFIPYRHGRRAPLARGYGPLVMEEFP